MEQGTQYSGERAGRVFTANGTGPASSYGEPLSGLERHPSERPIFALIVAVSLMIWALCIVSIVGLMYVLGFALFFYLAHVAFVAYLRGSAVRVGEQQFPELYARFVALAQRIGLRRVPELYLTHAGGSLNALATRFRGSNMVVLYSELLEACGDDEQARDFIMAHELAHLKANHLRWFWLTEPALLIPFLGHAYSRACEYTADRWGCAVSGGGRQCIHGLTILSVGGKLAKQVNLAVFLEQRESLRGGLMTIGCWLSTHPQLADRIAALEPRCAPVPRLAGTLKALVILGLVLALPIAGGAIGIAKLGALSEEQAESTSDEDEYAAGEEGEESYSEESYGEAGTAESGAQSETQ